MKQRHSTANAIMNQRQMLQYERFFIDLSVEETRGHVNIVRKREWLGIVFASSADKFILPPVFDHITFLSDNNYVMLCLDDLWGIFNVDKIQWGVFPVCRELTVHSDYATVELLTDTGKGLFSLKEGEMVVTPLFDDVTCWAGGDYLWVRRGAYYHFVRKADGVLVSLPDAIKAYDTPHGIFALASNRMVFCANDEGLDDAQTLRQVVRRGNGRARLYNYKEHNMDIIDIYGHILNSL